MIKEYFLKNYGKTNLILVSMSLAATWIWMPDIYISASISAQYGIWGLLYFLLPNILTLIIFGYFANKVKEELDGYTFFEYVMFKTKDIRQYRIYLYSSIIMLFCSTTIQLIGLKILFSNMFPNYNSTIIVGLVMVVVLLYSMYGGIKMSIYTDSAKYIIMIFCLIAIFLKIDLENIKFTCKVNQIFLLKTYGLANIINLMLASFLDQTLWQRIFSSKQKDIITIGWLSGFMFGIIPLILGMVGLTQYGNNSFNIVHYFNYYPYNIIIIVLIICTLVSTIDSNLTAMSSIVWNEFNSIKESKKYVLSIIAMIFLTYMSLFFSVLNIEIVTFVLIYGTIRTCVGIPSILIILDKYDVNRLWYSTMATFIICNIGYIYFSIFDKQYTYIFSILALILPLIGYSKNEN